VIQDQEAAGLDIVTDGQMYFGRCFRPVDFALD
jgi:methionine synthase II (cobalamin-independent)